MGRQSHMVVSVLIISGVSGNAPQAPHVFLQGRRHFHFSKHWWLLKSLWPSQRLWTSGWCLMTWWMWCPLASSIWLATWPEIICDSPKEERGKNLVGVLLQQSHHSVVEIGWTVCIISLSSKYQWLLLGMLESVVVYKRVNLLPLPSLLLFSSPPAGKRSESEQRPWTKCCLSICSDTASREQVKQQMACLYMAYPKATVFPIT